MQTLVIKVGGSIQDDAQQMSAVMRDVAGAQARSIVVHGGGKAINAALAAAGVASRFVAGQRYTDEATLRIADRVLAIDVNAQLCTMLSSHGGRAIGLHALGTCVLTAKRTRETGKPEMPEADLGLVGRVSQVAGEVLTSLCAASFTPVVAPVALDADAAAPGYTGLGKLNVNADLAGGAVAACIKPDRFVLISDTLGIRTDPKDASTIATTLSRAQLHELIARGAIDGGMLPKVQACFMALDAGVREIAIIDGRVPGALAVLLSGERVLGTRITNEE
jgi:acetylglutamate kinase